MGCNGSVEPSYNVSDNSSWVLRAQWVGVVLTAAPALVLCSTTRSDDVPVGETAIIFLVTPEAWSNWAPHPPTMVPFSVCVMKGTEKSHGQFGMCRSRHSLAMSYVMAAASSMRTNSLSRHAAGKGWKVEDNLHVLSVSL